MVTKSQLLRQTIQSRVQTIPPKPVPVEVKQPTEIKTTPETRPTPIRQQVQGKVVIQGREYDIGEVEQAQKLIFRGKTHAVSGDPKMQKLVNSLLTMGYQSAQQKIAEARPSIIEPEPMGIDITGAGDITQVEPDFEVDLPKITSQGDRFVIPYYKKTGYDKLVRPYRYEGSDTQKRQEIEKEISSGKLVGYKPIYSGGKLVGVEDTHAKISIDLKHLERHLEEQSLSPIKTEVDYQEKIQLIEPEPSFYKKVDTMLGGVLPGGAPVYSKLRDFTTSQYRKGDLWLGGVLPGGVEPTPIERYPGATEVITGVMEKDIKILNKELKEVTRAEAKLIPYEHLIINGVFTGGTRADYKNYLKLFEKYKLKYDEYDQIYKDYEKAQNKPKLVLSTGAYDAIMKNIGKGGPEAEELARKIMGSQIEFLEELALTSKQKKALQKQRINKLYNKIDDFYGGILPEGVPIKTLKEITLSPAKFQLARHQEFMELYNKTRERGKLATGISLIGGKLGEQIVGVPGVIGAPYPILTLREIKDVFDVTPEYKLDWLGKVVPTTPAGVVKTAGYFVPGPWAVPLIAGGRFLEKVGEFEQEVSELEGIKPTAAQIRGAAALGLGEGALFGAGFKVLGLAGKTTGAFLGGKVALLGGRAGPRTAQFLNIGGIASRVAADRGSKIIQGYFASELLGEAYKTARLTGKKEYRPALYTGSSLAGGLAGWTVGAKTGEFVWKKGIALTGKYVPTRPEFKLKETPKDVALRLTAQERLTLTRRGALQPGGAHLLPKPDIWGIDKGPKAWKQIFYRGDAPLTTKALGLPKGTRVPGLGEVISPLPLFTKMKGGTWQSMFKANLQKYKDLPLRQRLGKALAETPIAPDVLIRIDKKFKVANKKTLSLIESEFATKGGLSRSAITKIGRGNYNKGLKILKDMGLTEKTIKRKFFGEEEWAEYKARTLSPKTSLGVTITPSGDVIPVLTSPRLQKSYIQRVKIALSPKKYITATETRFALERFKIQKKYKGASVLPKQHAFPHMKRVEQNVANLFKLYPEYNKYWIKKYGSLEKAKQEMSKTMWHDLWKRGESSIEFSSHAQAAYDSWKLHGKNFPKELQFNKKVAKAIKVHEKLDPRSIQYKMLEKAGLISPEAKFLATADRMDLSRYGIVIDRSRMPLPDVMERMGKEAWTRGKRSIFFKKDGKVNRISTKGYRVPYNGKLSSITYKWIDRRPTRVIPTPPRPTPRPPERRPYITPRPTPRTVRPILREPRPVPREPYTSPRIVLRVPRPTPRPTPRTTYTPSRVILKVPPTFPFADLPGKIIEKIIRKKKKPTKGKGYYAYGKQIKTKRYIKLHDNPVTRARAKDIGAAMIDSSLSTNFEIRPTRKKPKKTRLPIKRGYYEDTKHKYRDYTFRTIKGKRKKTPLKDRWIERTSGKRGTSKKSYRLDLKQERKRITLLARRTQLKRRIKKLVKPKTKKRRKKRQPKRNPFF